MQGGVVEYYLNTHYTKLDLPNGLEREPLIYCKCDGNVTFTFLILGKMTLVDMLMLWKGLVYAIHQIDQIHFKGSLAHNCTGLYF